MEAIKCVIINTREKALLKKKNGLVSTVILTDVDFNPKPEYDRVNGALNVRITETKNLLFVLD